jgi:GTP cyclohydrolase II
MDFVQSFVEIFFNKYQIQYTKATSIFTKFGLFYVKAYRTNDIEFLVLMTENYSSVKKPIVYVDMKKHLCDIEDKTIIVNYNQINSALKLIKNDQGVFIYYSQYKEELDNFLIGINAKKNNSITTSKFKRISNDLDNFFNILGFILKDLELENIQLIANNKNVTKIVKLLNINVIKSNEYISYEYGK